MAGKLADPAMPKGATIGKMKKDLRWSKFPTRLNFTLNWEDEEESKVPFPFSCTFKCEDEEGSYFSPPLNFILKWEDEEGSKFPSPLNFTFNWEDEEESKFPPPLDFTSNCCSGQSPGIFRMYIYITCNIIRFFLTPAFFFSGRIMRCILGMFQGAGPMMSRQALHEMAGAVLDTGTEH